jgi:hypothetical protein
VITPHKYQRIAVRSCQYLHHSVRCFFSVAVSLLLTLITTPTHAGANDWFYRITPPNGGASFDVGPYNSEYGCKDWLGSAIFLHGPLCHDHPIDQNCVPIGNGFAYPTGFPYPVPSSEQIPSGACFESTAPGLHQGYYFFWYSDGHPLIGAAIGPFDYRACDRILAEAQTKAVTGTGCFYVGDTRE